MTAVLPCTSRALAATPRAGTRPVERWTRCVLSPFPAMLSPRLAPLAVPAVFAVLAACGGSEPAPAPPPPALPAPLPAPPAVAPASVVPTPPPTERRTVVDEFFGTKVTDDYRWLEDSNDPDVKCWSDAQNAFARSSPRRHPARAPPPRSADGAHRRAVAALLRPALPEGDALRHGARCRPKQQPMLVAMTAAADPDEPARRRRSRRRSIRPGGTDDRLLRAVARRQARRRLALARAAARTARSTFTTSATGKELGDVIPRVNGGTAGGSVAWNADGSGFYYTRYPHAGERPPEDLDFYQQVYFHKLGTPTDKDTYADRQGLPAHRRDHAAPERRRAATCSRSWPTATAASSPYCWAPHAAEDVDASWRDFADGVVDARFGPDDALYLLSQKDAPRRRILRLSTRRRRAARTGRGRGPPSEAVIDGFRGRPRRGSLRRRRGRRPVAGARLRSRRASGAAKPARCCPSCRSPRSARSCASTATRSSSRTRASSPPAWYRYVARQGRDADGARYARRRPTSATPRSCARRAPRRTARRCR